VALPSKRSQCGAQGLWPYIELLRRLFICARVGHGLEKEERAERERSLLHRAAPECSHRSLPLVVRTFYVCALQK